MCSVSVILPVYDENPDYLDRSVRSVLNQTFCDFELLIVEDGSTRLDTLSCLEELQQLDKRIRVLPLRRSGLVEVLNFGLAQAVAPLVVRQDSDDWSEPERLELTVNFFDCHPEVHLLTCSTAFHTEQGEKLWALKYPQDGDTVVENLKKDLPAFGGGASFSFRREAAIAIGGFSHNYPHIEDLDFLLRFIDRYRISSLPEVLYHIRYKAGSISGVHHEEQSRSRQLIFSSATSHVSVQGGTERSACFSNQWSSQGMLLSRLGDRLLVAGYFYRCLEVYWISLLKEPLSILIWLKIIRVPAFILFGRYRYFWLNPINYRAKRRYLLSRD